MSRKIELVKGWNGNTAGTRLEPEQDDVARALVNRGLAKYVDEPVKKTVKLQPWVKTKAVNGARDS